jgi:hypothetical protein
MAQPGGGGGGAQRINFGGTPYKFHIYKGGVLGGGIGGGGGGGGGVGAGDTFGIEDFDADAGIDPAVGGAR